MEFFNTHSHVYTSAFDDDRALVMQRAVDMGVSKIILPDIDAANRPKLLQTYQDFPELCVPLLGIHPTSVNENYTFEIAALEEALSQHTVKGIGEIGIDLYWDKTHIDKQIDVFISQITIAKQLHIPIVVHVRNSFDEVLQVLRIHGKGVTGIFHCFSGNLQQALEVIDMGFALGIGGVLTYKKSGLEEIVRGVSLTNIVLETDDPWLAPVPYRGKRNEPSYVSYVAQHVADCISCSVEHVAEVTSVNARRIFSL